MAIWAVLWDTPDKWKVHRKRRIQIDPGASISEKDERFFKIASLDCSLRSAAIGKQLHCYLNLNVEILEHLAANDRNQASQSGLGLIKSLNEYDSKRLQLAASGIIRMAEMRRGLYTEITMVRAPNCFPKNFNIQQLRDHIFLSSISLDCEVTKWSQSDLHVTAYAH